MKISRSHALKVFVLGALISSFSCKKEETPPPAAQPAASTPVPADTDMANGLPSNAKSINAYLYASYHVDHNGLNSTNFLYGFAVFADPARNLMLNYDHQADVILKGLPSSVNGNADVGAVHFSGSTLFNSASSTTSDVNRLIQGYSFTYQKNWNIAGSASFKAMNNLDVKRGFPLITNVVDVTPVNLSSGYTVTLTNFISNFDSVTVRLSNGPSVMAAGIQKTVPGSQTSVVFSSDEIKNLLTPNQKNYIYYRAFNYSNQRIDNKVYVFELSNKLEKQVLVTP